MPDSPDRYVIIAHSSFGEELGRHLHDTKREAVALAAQMAEDAHTANIPEGYSVHKLSEALWEG